MKFICPDCGCTELAEITCHAEVARYIQEIPEIEFDLEYVHMEVIDDGIIEQYQCDDCGFTLRHTKDSNPILEGTPIDNFKDLVQWLEENCEQHHIGKLPKENKNET